LIKEADTTKDDVILDRKLVFENKRKKNATDLHLLSVIITELD
jgi:hypothetical protein